MPVSILNLARSGEGTSLACELEFEDMADVDLARPAKGKFTILNSSDGTRFHVIGEVSAQVKAQCDRCLKRYERSIGSSLATDFTDQPTEDEWPIVNNSLDLAPLVREEILLHIPIKSICSDDCTGIVD